MDENSGAYRIGEMFAAVYDVMNVGKANGGAQNTTPSRVNLSEALAESNGSREGGTTQSDAGTNLGPLAEGAGTANAVTGGVVLQIPTTAPSTPATTFKAPTVEELTAAFIEGAKRAGYVPPKAPATPANNKTDTPSTETTSEESTKTSLVTPTVAELTEAFIEGAKKAGYIPPKTSTESTPTVLDDPQSDSTPLGVDEDGEMGYTETEVLTRDFLNQDESIEAFSEEKADAEKKAQEAPFAWPKQMHHFASNKNKKYTPQFEKITSKYGLKLDDRWNKETMNHLGRHPNEYHEWILESLKFSDSIANGDVDLFKAEFEKAKQRIRDNPILLRKKGWK